MKRSMMLFVLIAGLIPAVAFAVPTQIPYSGQLSESGQLVNGTRDLTIRIYDGQTGRAALYTESFTGVQVTNGVFHVELNAPEDLWTGADRWIGVTVGVGSELMPRTRIGSVPLAVLALETITASAVRQAVYAEVLGPVALPATIPADNTIPQISEGTQVLSASITPTSASHYLLVEAVLHAAEQINAGDYIIGALFRDTGVDAIAVSVVTAVGAASFLTDGQLIIRRRVLAGSRQSTSFTVRAGSNGGSALLNVTHQNNTLGSMIVSSLTVTEIKL